MRKMENDLNQHYQESHSKILITCSVKKLIHTHNQCCDVCITCICVHE